MRSISKVFCLLFLALVVLCHLTTSTAGTGIKCDSNKVYQYSFQQVSNVFGGAYFHIEGTLELYCGEKVHSKKLDTDLSVTSLHLVDGVSYLKPPKCANTQEGGSKTLSFEGKDKCKEQEAKAKELEAPKPYKGLERSFGFVQNANGKILRMFSHKGETIQARDLKKAIVSQFQTKLHGTSERIVEDNTGLHKTHYSKTVGSDGVVTIKAEHDDRDCADKESRINSRGTEQHTECQLTLSKSGNIEKVKTESSFEYKEENDDGKIKYMNQNNKDEGDIGAYVSVSGQMVIKLKGERAPNSKHTELHKILVLTKDILEGKAEEKDARDDHDLTIEHLDVLHSQILAEKQFVQHSTRVDSSEYTVAEDVKKKVEKVHGGFAKLFNKFMNDPSLLPLTIEYIELFPKETLPLVWTKFNSLKGREEEQARLQALMAESQSPLGVNMLLKTITEKPLNSKLIETGLFYTTSVEKPTVSLARFVQSYTKFVDMDISESKQSSIRTNAYLFMANVASKLSDQDARPFIEEIARRLQQTREERDTELNIIALQNMGKHSSEASAKVLETVLDDDEHTESTKIAALKALRSHVNDEDNEHPSLSHADALIHKVVLSDSYSDEAKVAAIRTQTYRQKAMSNDRSVEEFTTVLKNPKTSTEVFDAILDYLKNAQDKERVLALLKTSHDNDEDLLESYEFGDTGSENEELDEAKPLIADWLKGAGNTIVRGVTYVGNGIADGATAAAEATKKAAEEAARFAEEQARKAAEIVNVKKHAEDAYNAVKNMFFPGNDRDFNRRCYPTTSSGNDICVHDPYFKDMFGRVANDLKVLKTSRHYANERRAGNNAVHFYIGLAALSGSLFPGCSGVGETPYLWAAMFGFSSYVKLLMVRVPLLELEFKLNRLKTTGPLDDKIYILIGPVFISTSAIPGASILFNQGMLMAGNALECKPFDLDLKKTKVEKKLVEKQQIVMAGFVPLKFKIKVAAAFGVGIRLDICLGDHKVMAGPAPYLKLYTEVSGGASMSVFEASLSFTPNTEIRLPILFGIRKCSFAFEVGFWFTPFAFSISFNVKAKLVDWTASFPIYSYSVNPIGTVIYRYPTSGQALPASETGSPKPLEKAAHVFDPRKSLQKPVLPADITKFHFNWYTSIGPTVKPTAHRAPTRAELLQMSPPQEWDHQGDKIHIEARKTGIQCGWVELLGLYVYGYAYIPHGVKVEIEVSTDDVSWVLINGKQVVHDGCCGSRKHDITNHVKLGDWNLFDAAAAEYCHTGYIGIKFHSPQDVVPTYIPHNGKKVHVDSWYVAKGHMVQGLRRVPNEEEAFRFSPPIQYEQRKTQSVYIDHHTPGECGWVRMTTLYAKGWIFIPQLITKFYLRVATDDISFVRLNGQRVIVDGCCGWRVHDLTNNAALKRGAWNQITGITAEGCSIGYLGFDYDSPEEEAVVAINSNYNAVEHLGGNHWRQIGSNLMQVVVGGRPNTAVGGFLGHLIGVVQNIVGGPLIWALDRNQQIFEYRGSGKWHQINGRKTQISIGCDGELWGVNSAHLIYRYLGNDRWEQIQGGKSWMGVGSKNHIWGVNPNHRIYQYLGNNRWTHIQGSLSQISVSCDGKTVVGVNAQHHVFRYAGNHSWTRIPGAKTNVSVKPNGDIWGVNSGGLIYRMRAGTNFWVHIGGSMRSVSAF